MHTHTHTHTLTHIVTHTRGLFPYNRKEKGKRKSIERSVAVTLIGESEMRIGFTKRRPK